MPARSSYHYQGTCRMGDNKKIPKDESIVDTDSKVWNVDNLYVGCNVSTTSTCNSTIMIMIYRLHRKLRQFERILS